MFNHDLLSMIVFLGVFLGICCAGVLLALWGYRDHFRAVSRLRSLGSEGQNEAEQEAKEAGAALPRLGQWLMPRETDRINRWRGRLVQAGLYHPRALSVFLGIKMVLLLGLPVLFSVLPVVLGWLPLQRSLLVGVSAMALGLLGPNLWLEWRVACRQRALGRGLPDALDMLVLCLEGGLSMPAAVQKVCEELPWVHPVLSEEMNIVLREMEMGASPGEAFRRFGERVKLDALRELAAVLVQAERFGASVSKSLRIHADSWRLERQQRAEEQAQKAAVKILFPMLLCIFPAIFLVTLGPAALQIAKMFAR